MRHKRFLFISLIGICLLASSSFAQIPSPLKDIRVSGTVKLDKANSIYTYNYSVFNPLPNDGKIFHFEIDIAKPVNSQELSSKGLEIQRGINIRGKIMLRSFDDEVARIKKILRKPVIPVGAQPPLGHPFPGWTAAISVMGTVSWGGSEQSLILPNQTLGGFILTSHGLPGIRDVKIEPDLDVDKLPAEYYENVELTKQLQDGLIYHTKSIGPTSPPSDFKPLEFLNYIIDLKHQSTSLGWITNKGIENSLDVKLDNAKKKIEQGNLVAAKNILEAFVNEVEAQGCESYEKCPQGKHLTPEAYSLLKYNVQYLIEKL